MGVILDTSILIAAERKRFNLEALFVTHEAESFCIASVTAAELLHGVERSTPGSRRVARSEFVEQFLSRLQVIDFDLAVARQHARIWARLAQAGTIIGPYDLLIAATVLEHDCQLATLNSAEFKRVDGLRLLNIDAYSINLMSA